MLLIIKDAVSLKETLKFKTKLNEAAFMIFRLVTL